jgi:biopolymer transport protein ExbD
MHRPSSYNERRRDLDVKMTPMIDVVFLLLVFFIWTASFRIAELVLPSSVSTAIGTQASETEKPPPEDDFDQVVIRIVWREGEPKWLVNGEPVLSLQEVRDTLAAIAKIKSDAPVIVHPDAVIPLGHVIDVYDVTRLEGFQKVQFAAEIAES